MPELPSEARGPSLLVVDLVGDGALKMGASALHAAVRVRRHARWTAAPGSTVAQCPGPLALRAGAERQSVDRQASAACAG